MGNLNGITRGTATERGTFPPEWGTPPTDEAKRHAWICAHAARAAETGKAKAAAQRHNGAGTATACSCLHA